MTNNILRSQGILLILAVAVVGCGGKGAPTLTQSEFCAKKATKECDGVADKCLATSTNCQAARVGACNTFASENLNATTRPFRPEKADACLNKTAEIYAKATITPADRDAMNDLCARVFSGSKKEGADCANNYECDVAFICDTALSVCAKKKPVAVDAFCGNPGEVCAVGQYCSGAPPKCIARIAQGQACGGADLPCLESLRCAQTGANMACADKVVLFGSCTANSDCVSTGAEPAPYCDSYVGSICTKGFTPSGGSPECVNAFGGTAIGGGDGGAG